MMNLDFIMELGDLLPIKEEPSRELRYNPMLSDAASDSNYACENFNIDDLGEGLELPDPSPLEYLLQLEEFPIDLDHSDNSPFFTIDGVNDSILDITFVRAGFTDNTTEMNSNEKQDQTVAEGLDSPVGGRNTGSPDLAEFQQESYEDSTDKNPVDNLEMDEDEKTRVEFGLHDEPILVTIKEKPYQGKRLPRSTLTPSTGKPSPSSSKKAKQPRKRKAAPKPSGMPKTRSQSRKDDKNEGDFEELDIEDKKLLRLRPRMTKHVKNPVPEEKKDNEYFEKRKKNTLAAQRCRERKRETDEKRVNAINQLKAEISMRSGDHDWLEQIRRKNVRVNEEKDRYKKIVEIYFEGR